MSFARPELALVVLAGPLVALAAALLWRRRLAAARAWASRALWDRLLAGYRPARLAASIALLGVAVSAAGLALARPRWGESRETVERVGVDVVLVLDASLSMGARDVAPSRLAAAKALLRRLAEASPQHRLALVAAAGDGVVMVPLTTDAALVDLVLDAVEPGALPVQGTALAAALRKAGRVFGPAGAGGGRHRAVVLASDGEDHVGGLAAAGAELAEAGVVVHSLGLGSLEGAPVPVAGGSGGPGSIKRHADGSVVLSRLDEEALEGLAAATGGTYLRAADGARDLGPLLAALDDLEGRSIESEVVDLEAERFQWPLALSAAALVLFLGLPVFGPGRPGSSAAGPAPGKEAA